MGILKSKLKIELEKNSIPTDGEYDLKIIVNGGAISINVDAEELKDTGEYLEMIGKELQAQANI